MPSVWTHVCFCENVVDAIGITNPFLKQETIMKLGAQGPSLFNYCKLKSQVDNDSIQTISMIMHSNKSEAFLIDLIEEAKHNSKEVQAFVIGFIIHHILEQQTYPFIYAHAGEDPQEQRKYELNIDTLLMEKYHNLQTWKVPVHKELDVGFSLNKTIAKLLYKIILKHFPTIKCRSEKVIQKSYQKMKLSLKLTYDPLGWKNALFGPLISSHSYRSIKNDQDYLNTSNQRWYHPIKHIFKTKSFEDLYDQAKVEAVEVLTEVLTYWRSNDDVAKVRISKLLSEFIYDQELSLRITSIKPYNQRTT